MTSLVAKAALLLSWLVVFSAGSASSAAALTGPEAAPGVSHTVLDTSRVSAVGALFRGPVSDGDHFCSAAVVDSPAGNLLITAAHCLSGESGAVYFAPGYHDGLTPYGSWRITGVTVDPRWTADEDPDYDVAFATVAASGGEQVQQAVGGYPLATGRDQRSLVRLIGYPASAAAPLSCVNRTTAFSATQLRIACTAYTGGTSGSPWLTRDHEVMGVIGGYQQGGDTADVSYSAYFGESVAALYQQAVAPS